ncbi:MAG: YceI family protein [Acidimicrobiales bacterium]
MTVATLPKAGTWSIDPSHSSVEFVVRHLVVSKVKGRFGTFAGTVSLDPAAPLAASVGATLQVASIDTGDAQRDTHLRSADFFDAETYPTITFRSTAVRQAGDDFDVDGDLTIRGVTKPVSLRLEYNGTSPDPWGGTRAGFSGETELNRRDFGLDFDVKLDTGGALVGEKIKIHLEVETILQAA